MFGLGFTELSIIVVIASEIVVALRKKKPQVTGTPSMQKGEVGVNRSEKSVCEQGIKDIPPRKSTDIPDSMSFLHAVPTSEEELTAGITIDVASCLNYAARLNGFGNHKDAVVWLNKGLSMNPNFHFAIMLHRNRAVAIAEEHSVGSVNHKNNLDYCIAVESVMRDFEAIIGLYAQNEAAIEDMDNSEIIDNSFEMALTRFMPIGLSNMTYQKNGSYHLYTDRLSHVWNISFVAEPKDALCVNGKVYPHYVLPK